MAVKSCLLSLSLFGCRFVHFGKNKLRLGWPMPVPLIFCEDKLEWGGVRMLQSTCEECGNGWKKFLD